MDRKPLIAITGIDSGIGKSLCEVLAANGFAVAGSYLESNPFGENPDIHAFPMDLRKEEEISAFADFVAKLCKSDRYYLYGIVNNAGIALGGPIEEMPLSIFRDVFEVNFFGLVSFTQKMIPLLIETKGGIFIHGSMAGKLALPFLSPYATSKFALEGFCDSLRRETAQFGIRTVLFETGGIATPIWEKAKRKVESFTSERYFGSIRLFAKNFIEQGLRGWSADLAAEQMYRSIVAKHPSRRYIIDSTRGMDWLIIHLPASLIDLYSAKRFALMGRREAG